MSKPVRSFIHGDTVTTYWDTGEVTVQSSREYFKSIKHANEHTKDQEVFDHESDYAGYAE